MEFLRLNLLAPLLLSLSLLLPLTLAVDVTYCDKNADYDVTVQGVEISPYPVVRGSPATFSISANTGETITGGKLVIDVSYFGWHIHSETHDLCEESSCPVSSGDFVISHTQVLPGFTPPGTYNLKMKLVDKKNKELTCIGFDFSIGFVSPVADS
ncbi:hypothetical protein VitviT2T_011593 [Vitis vinifera]|uniref:MD-2-related lipid-recognition domain-containing protein n=3 Tax=Vitis vinifera TaxID=29760 RepID=A5AFH3_VITVI|eukprot:XP_002271535.1 PREDICTED: putative phosphatidylglycerol/phosphatidylinositol transfer protein DDB_G0282179 [Vitis vinifera]